MKLLRKLLNISEGITDIELKKNLCGAENPRCSVRPSAHSEELAALAAPIGQPQPAKPPNLGCSRPPAPWILDPGACSYAETLGVSFEWLPAHPILLYTPSSIQCLIFKY